MDDAWFELNRAWWDERVATHVGSDFYGVERFLEGWSPLRPYEVAEAGDVTGLDLVHLQCHFGMDQLLRPGGRLHLVEFHPVTHWCLSEHDLSVKYSFFHEGPWVWDDDPDATFEHNDTVEWNHGLGAIVTALAAAGLRIESLVERPTLFMQRWPFQVEHGHQDWRNPPELPQIPLSFSLLAQKPVAS